MITYNHVPESGDPSGRIQCFEQLDISVLCCRYWVVDKWTMNNMSFPYWRYYWNKNEGAYVQIDKKTYLTKDKFFLIPPNTVFSTGIDKVNENPDYDKFDFAGSWVENADQEAYYLEQNRILHFYIHFRLGGILDNAYKGIFVFDISDRQLDLIEKISQKLMQGSTGFNIYSSIDVYLLILSAVNRMPETEFTHIMIDKRLQAISEYIQSNLDKKLVNSELANQANMATNSFTRLFRDQMNCSPQEYVRNCRIAKACDLLDHSILSIDGISELCGFSDRFHFSKVFKKIKGIAPAEYKKRFILS